MRILIVIRSLHVGGGEMIPIRFANALADTEHEVSLLNLSYAGAGLRFSPEQVISSKLSFFDLSQHSLIALYQKFPDFFIRLANPFLDIYRRYVLKKIVKSKQIEVINSHLMAADTLVASAKLADCVFVITMHGSYESNLKLNPLRRIFTINQADAIVYTADKNLGFKNLPYEFDKPLYKLRNGYARPGNIPVLSRHTFGIAKDDLVFVLAARSDPRKGWVIAIESFLELYQRNSNMWLILVGGGEYLDGLKDKYQQQKGLIFAGFTNTPQSYLGLADIGLLPSTFPGESLPFTIVEYLSEGLAVIASDIGDIKYMIQSEGVKAGILVDVKDGYIAQKDMVNAMEEYINNDLLLTEHKQNTKYVFEQFSMHKCIENYLKIFRSFTAK